MTLYGAIQLIDTGAFYSEIVSCANKCVKREFQYHYKAMCPFSMCNQRSVFT